MPGNSERLGHNFEIISVKDEAPGAKLGLEVPVPVNDLPFFRSEFPRLAANTVEEDGDSEFNEEQLSGTSSSRSRGYFGNQNIFELIQSDNRYGEVGLDPLMYRGSSIFSLKSEAMDPFNAMALPITPREQVLLRYYCESPPLNRSTRADIQLVTDHTQVDTPLIPYCQAWTDLNTANDLWQKPHFPALELPLSLKPKSFEHPRLANFSAVDSASTRDSFSLSPAYVFQPSTPSAHAARSAIDKLLIEIRDLAEELVETRRLLNSFNRPQIPTSDKIHVLERKVFAFIHTPLFKIKPLDRACAIASMIFMRSNLRDNICNFRIIDTTKLQTALQELGDLRQWGNDLRDREKLAWTVGFGAVGSTGRPERKWFKVLWKNELDMEGLKLWEDMGIDDMVGIDTLALGG
ncbi:hypothetical protein D0Z07_2276 [Hyphodiscus hymeniophilus]|uniref:Uncharacterized protein n=1 Tax=Hyphodiscus hymeniophilus TaxID=353542 RepID=A0A9P6VMN6_9HELO|nr:hypothetical protein D0Z07_2276 [Hyphodiscus hymeniophilus]